MSYVVVESYNAALSIHQLLENSAETFVIDHDNKASYNISHNIIKQQQSKYVELNWVISLLMMDQGKLNDDLGKLCNFSSISTFTFFGYCSNTTIENMLN